MAFSEYIYEHYVPSFKYYFYLFFSEITLFQKILVGSDLIDNDLVNHCPDLSSNRMNFSNYIFGIYNKISFLFGFYKFVKSLICKIIEMNYFQQSNTENLIWVLNYFVKICSLLLNILYLFFRKMTPPLTMVISWLMEYSLRYDLPQLKSELKDLFPNLVVLDKLEIPDKKTLVDLATLRLIINRCLIKLVNREHLCIM